MVELHNVTETIDFIGIGAPRCATSWITYVLRAHPEICLSEPKEIRYFNRYQLPIAEARDKVNPNFDRDLSWYLRRFSHAREGQIKGEYSPLYMYDQAAAPTIRRSFPDVKLIACLRNPVERAFSSYRFHRGEQLIGNISFERALQQEEVYVDMGFYARQLKRYMEHFDHDQFMVLIFEDLIRNPSIECQRLFQFLGVAPELELDFSRYATNKPARVRSRAFRKATNLISQMLVDAKLSNALAALRKLGVHSMVNRINSASLHHPPMAEATRRRLLEIFSSDIVELEELLDRDLGQWKVTI